MWSLATSIFEPRKKVDESGYPTSKTLVEKCVKVTGKLLLFIGDFLVAMLALAASILIWSQSPEEWLNLSPAFLRERVPVWFYLLPVIWLLLLVEMYDTRRADNRQNTFKGYPLQQPSVPCCTSLFISHPRLDSLAPARRGWFHYWGIRINPVVEISAYFSIFTQHNLCAGADCWRG